MTAYLAEVTMLRAQVEDLSARVRDYERQFCRPLPELWRLGLSPGPTRVLRALYLKDYVTHEGIGLAAGTMSEHVRYVYINKIRNWFGRDRITVETICDIGYRLTPEARERVRFLVEGDGAAERRAGASSSLNSERWI